MNKLVKRTYILLLVILCLSSVGYAQVSDDNTITLTASLNSSLSLTIDQSSVNINFDTDEDYKSGIGLGKYFSKGNIAATTNWKLSCKAITKFVHEDGKTVMPLNNIGVSAKYNGTSTVKNYTDKTTQALSLNEIDLIGYDGVNSNANDKDENSFVLYWEMGTMNGNMNSQNLLKQNLKKGSYSTKLAVVVTEVIK